MRYKKGKTPLGEYGDCYHRTYDMISEIEDQLFVTAIDCDKEFQELIKNDMETSRCFGICLRAQKALGDEKWLVHDKVIDDLETLSSYTEEFYNDVNNMLQDTFNKIETENKEINETLKYINDVVNEAIFTNTPAADLLGDLDALTNAIRTYKNNKTNNLSSYKKTLDTKTNKFQSNVNATYDDLCKKEQNDFDKSDSDRWWSNEFQADVDADPEKTYQYIIDELDLIVEILEK